MSGTCPSCGTGLVAPGDVVDAFHRRPWQQGPPPDWLRFHDEYFDFLTSPRGQ